VVARPYFAGAVSFGAGTTLNLVRATGDQRAEGRLWEAGAHYV
jgi:hypothetical protein